MNHQTQSIQSTHDFPLLIVKPTQQKKRKKTQFYGSSVMRLNYVQTYSCMHALIQSKQLATLDTN